MRSRRSMKSSSYLGGVRDGYWLRVRKRRNASGETQAALRCAVAEATHLYLSPPQAGAIAEQPRHAQQ
jgi:hypothetical protein